MQWIKSMGAACAAKSPKQKDVEGFSEVLPAPPSAKSSFILPNTFRLKESAVATPLTEDAKLSVHERSTAASGESAAKRLDLPAAQQLSAQPPPPISLSEDKRAKLEHYRLLCSEVVPGFLYVSGEDGAKDASIVAQACITHVLNCAGPQCPNHHAADPAFTYLRLNLYDHASEDILWFVYPALDFITAARAAGGRVLLHCAQGVSRSCSLAIAWLMHADGASYQEAYAKTRACRGVCAPNPSFICGLLEWQKRRAIKGCDSPPLLYRTAYHSPLLPEDLLLKLCVEAASRAPVAVSAAALDTRACFVVVVNSSTSASDSSSSADSAAVPDSTVRTVHVWQGSSAAPGMLELALQGAQWMQQYEHCVAVAAAPAAAVEREGSESAAFLAALGVSALAESAGECSLYSDLQPPVTAAAAAAAVAVALTLRRNDSQLDKSQLAVTADDGSRSSSAVSDSSSSNCTTAATATAAVAAGATLKHSEALSPQSPRGSYVLYECVRGSSTSSSSNLSSSSSSSSGAETAGYQWKHVAVYDDQDLAPDACLLLLHSGATAASVSTDSTSSSSNSKKLAPSFVWVGEEFAADNITDTEEQFVRRVTVTDGSWSLAVSKLYFEAPGEESDKFWAAFEAGY
jgi:predicted protein tyrosine phosphatase